MTSTTPLPALLESFFTDRLMQQRQASEHTIASYRDTFRLVLAYAQGRLKKAPSELTLEDLNAAFIGPFLNHLEKERRNSARSRNQRLAAIHSFFRYVALREPRRAALIQQVLAIPSNATIAHWSRSSHGQRSTRSSLRPTARHSRVGETTHCSSWPSKRDCARPS